MAEQRGTNNKWYFVEVEADIKYDPDKDEHDLWKYHHFLLQCLEKLKSLDRQWWFKPYDENDEVDGKGVVRIAEANELCKIGAFNVYLSSYPRRPRLYYGYVKKLENKIEDTIDELFGES
jgi:hypothetical protein